MVMQEQFLNSKSNIQIDFFEFQAMELLLNRNWKKMQKP